MSYKSLNLSTLHIVNNNNNYVSENLILNQGCSQKYNYNENIHVDNNKIRTLEIMREKKENNC